jgi:hypothetical protein
LRIGAVAFIHRFGSSLNTHVHFHCCVVNGVFEAVPSSAAANVASIDADSAQATDRTAPPRGVVFHPASGLDAAAVAQVQADAQRRILRAFVRRDLIEADDALQMGGYPLSPI